MIIHSLFDHPQWSGITNDFPSLTQQHFADDANINTIVDRYTRTGVLPVQIPGIFADCSSVPQDYADAIRRVREADALFQSLPSRVRAEFNNSPSVFLDRMSDPSFVPRSIELGLRVAPAASSVSSASAADADAAVTTEA